MAMKTRLPYLLTFLIILAVEIFIGAFVRDAFIRPYVGDILVAVLLCCLLRCFFPTGKPWLSALVLGFCVLVEVSQYFHLTTLLGLQGTVFEIILGATFAWADLLCYFIGCCLFYIAEYSIHKSH